MARRRAGQKAVLIIGAGGHGKVVSDCLTAAGRRIAGWIDDNPHLAGRRVAGFPVLGTRQQVPRVLAKLRTRPEFVVAIGKNHTRSEVFDEMLAAGLTPTNVLHPSVILARSAQLGRGVMLLPGVIINADAVIGDNVIVNTAASVDHDNVLERDAHICPGAHTAGWVRVGRGANIGLGAAVLPRVTIGAWSTIGAGAVVTHDVPERATAVGVPAAVRP